MHPQTFPWDRLYIVKAGLITFYSTVSLKWKPFYFLSVNTVSSLWSAPVLLKTHAALHPVPLISPRCMSMALGGITHGAPGLRHMPATTGQMASKQANYFDTKL